MTVYHIILYYYPVLYTLVILPYYTVLYTVVILYYIMLYRIIPFILHSRPSLGARRPALPPYADGPGWRTCMLMAIKTDLPDSIWPPYAGPAPHNDPGGSLAVAAGSHGGPGGGMDWIERVLECTIEKIGRSPDTKIKPTAGGTMGGKEGQRIPQPRYQKRYTQDTKKVHPWPGN